MEGPATTDYDLAARSRSGDLGAFRSLVTAYQEQVIRIAYRVSGDFHAAEDIAQDSFLRAFQKLDSFDPSKGKFSSWLFTITRNLALNSRRKVEHFPSPSIDEESTDLPSPAENSEQRDQMRQLDRAINEIEEPFRSAFLLAEIEELPLQQISEIENVAIGTIKSRISRAKASLRESITRTQNSST